MGPARRKLVGCMDNIFKKANSIHEFSGGVSRVAVVIEHEGEFYVYRSVEVESWPPPMAEIVSFTY